MNSVVQAPAGFSVRYRYERRDLGGWPAARCYVYEVWDSWGRLAYVGMTNNFSARWRQHQDKSWWLREIDVDRVIVNAYPSTRAAHMAEAATINDQSPVYNTKDEAYWYRAYLSSDEGLPALAQKVFVTSAKAEVVS